MATGWQRVSKEMVQMFGPQWTEKFGAKNEMWETALKDMTYAQVTAGIQKVMRGALKFYEIDLPRFLELCKPPPAPRRPEQVELPKWAQGLCEAELRMHYQANCKLFVWCCRHPEYGIDAPNKFSTKQNQALWKVTRKISRDFFQMREEMGASSVPDEDFFTALKRNWTRVVDQEK